MRCQVLWICLLILIKRLQIVTFLWLGIMLCFHIISNNKGLWISNPNGKKKKAIILIVPLKKPKGKKIIPQSISPTDVFISDYSTSTQTVADFPVSTYNLIESNQSLSIRHACICLCPACLQPSWLLKTSHSSIELLSPLLLPSW